ncbi:MAG: LysE family translocator [Hyphomicrobiales bacterium]|nr:LysE family translocator [Hyphomicrobiales bacterium]MCP5001985.1 LysE family translocator [Hyphomicrobiales bacterium]
MSDLLLLWIAAFPLMGSPGPATLSLAAIGAAFGARSGLSYLAGIVAGTTVVLVMIATGVTGLILAQPVLVNVITVLAAAYILYLAYRIATAPVMAEHLAESRPPVFYNGFILAIANPKAFAAIGAVYSVYGLVPSNIMLDAIARIGALFFVIVVVNSCWLFFGSAFSSLLQHPVAGRIANITFAVLLVVSVALAVLVAPQLAHFVEPGLPFLIAHLLDHSKHRAADRLDADEAEDVALQVLKTVRHEIIPVGKCRHAHGYHNARRLALQQRLWKTLAVAHRDAGAEHLFKESFQKCGHGAKP